MPNSIFTAGVDVGGTKVQTAVLENGKKIVGSAKKPTGMEIPDVTQADLIDSIVSALSASCKKAGISLDKIAAVGAGCTGQIEAETGDALNSPHLKWDRFPLRRLLAESVKKPVTIVNDVQAAAWGEYSNGAGKGSNTFVCIFVGTGIGSGIVIDGKLYRGASGSAGEAGHSHFKLNGVRCQCGQQGCAEAYAGGESLMIRARRAIRGGAKSRIESLVGGDLSNIPANVIYQAAMEGDELAEKLWKDVELAVGVLCHNYVDILNPDIIALGGGIVEGVPSLLDFARKYVIERAVPIAAEKVKILAPKLGKLSPAVGAANLAFINLK